MRRWGGVIVCEGGIGVAVVGVVNNCLFNSNVFIMVL
jgi:hypothetical protein